MTWEARLKENGFISANFTLLKIRLFTVSSNIKFLYNFPYDYGEICVLLKLLEKKTYWEQFGVGGEFDEESDTNKFLSLHELCFTCWTIHATCFQKLNNYSLLLSLWEQSLRQRLNAETSARIKDWKSRIESLIFLFFYFFYLFIYFFWSLPWSKALWLTTCQKHFKIRRCHLLVGSNWLLWPSKP